VQPGRGLSFVARVEDAIIARPKKFNDEQRVIIIRLIEKHGALGAKQRYGDISYPTILQIAREEGIELCRGRRRSTPRRLTARQQKELAKLTSLIPMA
jgi:transposase